MAINSLLHVWMRVMCVRAYAYVHVCAREPMYSFVNLHVCEREYIQLCENVFYWNRTYSMHALVHLHAKKRECIRL